MVVGSSRKISRPVCIAVAMSAAALQTASAAFDAKDTKIIDLSWTTPMAPQLGSELATHQHLPFDGVITDLIQNNPAVGNGNPPDLFAWRAWAPAMNTASFSQATSSLSPASLGKFKDSLLRFNVAGPQMDWFDSSGVLANAQFASSIMAQGGFKGIVLDTEYYPNVAPGTAFDYNTQPQKASHSFAQYQAQARLVGGQFMQALRTQNPDAQVMLTFGYKVLSSNQSNWQNETYGLLPSFIDGMLDQASPNNLIIDGFEDAYGYNSSAQYDAAYQTMKVDNALKSANPSAFATNYKASYSFWLDRGPNGQSTVWDPNNIANNQYSPAQFQFALQEATKRSEKYVWIYSQIASWWNGNIPQAYVDALKNVRKTGQFERFRGTIKDTATWTAHTEQSGAVTQNNSLFLDALNFSTASQADYTTKTAGVGVGGLVSVEVKNTTSTTNTSLWANAKIGLILTNDSGGQGASALNDTRALSLLWSNGANAVLAGVSDDAGLNQYTTVSSSDHPTNTNYIYQIERLSATTAKFTLIDPNGGAIIGTPQVRSFAGVPGDLFVSLFAQGGDATFNNVWIAAAVYSGWSKNGSGDWNTLANWSTTSIPNATDAKALLGGAILAPRTVYADSNITLGSLKFDNANGYQITGQGSLSMDVSSGSVTIDVLQGSHKINLPLFVNDSATANIQSGATLKISNPMTLVNGATLTKIGAGTLSIEAPVFTATAASVVASAGALSLSADLGRSTALTVNGGRVEASHSQHLSSVDATSGELVLSNRSMLATSALELTGNAKIDLRDGKLLVDYSGDSPLQILKQAMQDGRIVSALADGDFTVGIGEAADLGIGAFGGEVVDASAAIAAFTVRGDANLDGFVDSADFNLLVSNYGLGLDARWTRGDFDDDGRVNSTDFNVLAGHFGVAIPAPALGAVVPEPMAAGVLFAAMVFAARRRI